jgi:predicted negative regulator of RcsB-dependent stress response
VVEYREDVQVDLADWLRRYGIYGVAVVVIGIMALLAWQGFATYQRRQSVQASKIYEALQPEQGETINPGKLQQTAQSLMQDYPKSPYAALAAWQLAVSEMDAGHLQQAQPLLQWALEHAVNVEMHALAQLRLAQLELALGHADKVLALLDKAPSTSFASAYAELKGDALVAAGNPVQAKEAYQAALTGMPVQEADWVRLKLENIRGVK